VKAKAERGQFSADYKRRILAEAQCDSTNTLNQKHFVGSEQCGIRLLTPRDFLVEIGEVQ